MFEELQRSRWIDLLEQELPKRLDCVSPEGYEPVSRQWLIPGSVEIVEVHRETDRASGTVPHLVVRYQLSSQEVTEIEGLPWIRGARLPIEVEVPFGIGDSLLLDKVDWLGPDDEVETPAVAGEGGNAA